MENESIICFFTIVSIFFFLFKKRTISENDGIICEMIRQDSIKEFVSYTNRNYISIKSQIEPSIFETNPF